MSIISTLYNLKFEIWRLVAIQRQDVLVLLTSGHDGCIRPIAKAEEMQSPAEFARQMVLYCNSNIDLKAGDVIKTGGKEYGVAGVVTYEDLAGSEETHIEARLFIK